MATLKLSTGHQHFHERSVVSKIKVHWKSESGWRDQREQAERLPRRVAVRTRRLGMRRIRWVRVKILEEVTLQFGVESLLDDK